MKIKKLKNIEDLENIVVEMTFYSTENRYKTLIELLKAKGSMSILHDWLLTYGWEFSNGLYTTKELDGSEDEGATFDLGSAMMLSLESLCENRKNEFN